MQKLYTSLLINVRAKPLTSLHVFAGKVYSSWTVGIQQTSKLPGGDPAMVRAVPVCVLRHAWTSIPQCGFSALRLVLTETC